MSADVDPVEPVKHQYQIALPPESILSLWIEKVCNGKEYVQAFHEAHQHITESRKPYPGDAVLKIKEMLRVHDIRLRLEEGFLLRGNLVGAIHVLTWGACFTAEEGLVSETTRDTRRAYFGVALIRQVAAHLLKGGKGKLPGGIPPMDRKPRKLRAVPEGRTMEELEDDEPEDGP